MFWGQSFSGLFAKGGFMAWPLLLCSVVGLAIILERSFYFLRLRLHYESFKKELFHILLQKKIKEAILFCKKKSHPVPQIVSYYLKHLHDDELRNDILKREGSFALEKVESRLRGLATVTHIAPLLGLLGTVTGLVTAFYQIQQLGGAVQPGDLAAGIWEALLTTVFGLTIAIPCMVAYHGFSSIADGIARRLQFIISELDEFFGNRSFGDFQAENPETTTQSMRTVK